MTLFRVVAVLLRRLVCRLVICDVFRYFVAILYLCESNSNRQNGSDQSRISYCNCYYVEELEL